jgi:hypothetical protein
MTPVKRSHTFHPLLAQHKGTGGGEVVPHRQHQSLEICECALVMVKKQS